MRNFSIFLFLSGLATSVSAVQLADSIADFSMVQGQNGWRYGYYDVTQDGINGTLPYHLSDFQLMTQNYGTTWWVNNINSTTNGYFTRLYANGGHGNGNDAYPGRLRALREHFAIRRWTSTYTGPVEIELKIRKIDTAGGNGVGFHVYRNGTSIFGPNMAFTSGVVTTFLISSSVAAGDHLDFALDPWQAQDANDNSQLSMKIYAVPEPSSVISLSLAAGLFSRKLRTKQKPS